MKKIILTVILAFAVFNAKAQLPYKQLSQFNGDTVAYLEYNFVTHKSAFIGNTVEMVIEWLEIPIYQVNSFGPYVQADNKSYMHGIDINYEPRSETLKKWRDRGKPVLVFSIEFEPPYEDDWAFWYYAPPFTSERDKAVYVKDKIVKDIKVRIRDTH
ncbi:MAG: hypothetical protein LBP85_02460 [Prevotellaceae bacterium]|jgi:hypothetical protein|nr:hypothetical protein [Prevotellaceae bacterium]